MKTISMESQKIALAQDILSIDSAEVLNSMVRSYKRAMARLSEKKKKEEKMIDGIPAEEYIFNGLKEAIVELGKIKRGELKGIPAEELLKELQAMEEAG
jgi:hypothetical protein